MLVAGIGQKIKNSW